MKFSLEISVLLIILNYSYCYVSYNNFAVVKALPKTITDLKSLNEIKNKFGRDVDFWSEPNILLDPVTLNISPRLKRTVLKQLSKQNVNFTIETNNFGEWIESDRKYIMKTMAKQDNFTSVDFEQYYNYEKIVDILKSMQEKYPSTVKYSSIGTTYEMRDIPSIVIDNYPNQKKPSIVFECGIHAREWVSPATCLWIINDLLTTDTGKKLLEVHSYHFMVLTNPDGYVFTWKHNRMWRKNRIPGPSYLYFDCSGVDLNRNFDSHFGANLGSSNDRCDNTYKGRHAFSEKETQAVRDYVRRVASINSIDVYFSVHSFTQVWMYPYSSSFDLPKNNDQYNRLSRLSVEAIKKTNGETYRFGNTAIVMYRASGASIDWMELNKLSKLTFALELRDKGRYGFRLPPQFIKPTAQEVWNGIKVMLNNM